MCDNEYSYGTGVTQAYFQINRFVRCYTRVKKDKKHKMACKLGSDMQQAVMFVFEGRRKGGVDE